MRFFSQYKKTFATIGILAIILPSIFLIQPKRAEAVVPVFDLENFLVNEAMLAQQIEWQFQDLYFDQLWEAKEFQANEFGALGAATAVTSLDSISWFIFRAIISLFIDQILNWVREGKMNIFGEPGTGPLWVEDLRRLFEDEIIRMSGIWLERYLDPAVYDLLCEPWRDPVFIKLTTEDRLKIVEPDRYEPECTLLDIIDNIEGMADFMNDFNNGSWEAWLSLSEERENDVFGAYLSSYSSMQSSSERAADRSDTEAQMGNSFIGQKLCELYSPLGTYCEEFTIDSPGTWISEEVARHTTSQLRTVEGADEMSEVLFGVMELLVGLLAEWLEGGLGGRL